MAPRRVLIVTQYYWPEVGAPQVRYAAITRALVRMGVQVDVLTGAPSYPGGRIHRGYSAWRPMVETHDGVRIHRLPMFAYGGTSRRLRLLNHGSLATTAILGTFMDLHPDLVVAESPPLPLVVPAAMLARRSGARLVMYCADLWPAAPLALGALRPGFVADRLADLESLCYRMSWRITVPTDGLYAKLRSHPDAGPTKVLLLPNGVDTEIFRPHEAAECRSEREQLGALGDRALFAYAGTLGPAHAVVSVLEAAAMLRDDPRIGFAIIGDGPDRAALEAKASALQLDNVRFLGSVSPARLARFLSLARATISPLRDLAFFSSTRSAQVLPALACGTPVIFCGRGESAAMLERERCGIVVPPEDAVALADAVRQLASDADRAATLGGRGREFARREFDFAVLVRRWWEALSAAAG